MVSALRHVPKPGYGLAPRSHTFSASTAAGGTTAVHPVATVSAFSVLLYFNLPNNAILIIFFFILQVNSSLCFPYYLFVH